MNTSDYALLQTADVTDAARWSDMQMTAIYQERCPNMKGDHDAR